MNTLLFAVGIFVFMLTVYGTVVAGGVTLKRKQIADLAPNQTLVVNADGYKVITTAPRNVVERSDPPTS